MLDLVMVAAIDSDRAMVVDLAIGSTPMHVVSFDTTVADGLVTTRVAAGNWVDSDGVVAIDSAMALEDLEVVVSSVVTAEVALDVQMHTGIDSDRRLATDPDVMGVSYSAMITMRDSA